MEFSVWISTVSLVRELDIIHVNYERQVGVFKCYCATGVVIQIHGETDTFREIYSLKHSLSFIECFKIVNFIEFLINSTEFST